MEDDSVYLSDKEGISNFKRLMCLSVFLQQESSARLINIKWKFPLHRAIHSMRSCSWFFFLSVLLLGFVFFYFPSQLTIYICIFVGWAKWYGMSWENRKLMWKFSWRKIREIFGNNVLQLRNWIALTIINGHCGICMSIRILFSPSYIFGKLVFSIQKFWLEIPIWST